MTWWDADADRDPVVAEAQEEILPDQGQVNVKARDGIYCALQILGNGAGSASPFALLLFLALFIFIAALVLHLIL